jgi:hypothetical protein
MFAKKKDRRKKRTNIYDKTYTTKEAQITTLKPAVLKSICHWFYFDFVFVISLIAMR